MEQRYKYPRTPHLPWSNPSKDDKVIKSLDRFKNDPIIVTEKMDGENTTLYRDGVHARSIDGRYHPSRAWVKQLQGQVGYKIPEGYRICGENMFAEHSITYDNLESYFLAFNVWYKETCLNWFDTQAFLKDLNIAHVPILYTGPFDVEMLKTLAEKLEIEGKEGYVVRTKWAFNLDEFNQVVAKFVRKNHVQTDSHWMHSEMKINKVMENKH